MEYREKKFKSGGDKGKKSWKKENAGRNGNNGRDVNGKTERNSGRKETQNFVSGTEKRNGRKNHGFVAKLFPFVHVTDVYFHDRSRNCSDCILQGYGCMGVGTGIQNNTCIFKSYLMNFVNHLPFDVALVVVDFQIGIGRTQLL